MVLSKKGVAQQKTDVAEHPEVFRHIGLLFNEPPGSARLPFYLVIRKAAACLAELQD
jgi:hypothetical protein